MTDRMPRFVVEEVLPALKRRNLDGKPILLSDNPNDAPPVGTAPGQSRPSIWPGSAPMSSIAFSPASAPSWTCAGEKDSTPSSESPSPSPCEYSWKTA